MTVPVDSLSDNHILFEWTFKQQSDVDLYMNKEEFTVRVLTKPAPLNDKPNQYVFMGRLLGDGAPSPHENFLPDPCEISLSEKADVATRLISLHTRFIVHKQPEMPNLSVGDVIYGRMEAGFGGDGGGYDLQIAKLERVGAKFSLDGNKGLQSCSALSNLNFTELVGSRGEKGGV